MCFFCFFWLLKEFGESLRVTILSPLLRIESGKMFSGDKKGPNGHVLVILMVFWCFHMLTCTTCLMKIMEPYQIQYPNISEKILQSGFKHACYLFEFVVFCEIPQPKQTLCCFVLSFTTIQWRRCSMHFFGRALKDLERRISFLVRETHNFCTAAFTTCAMKKTWLFRWAPYQI